MDENRVNEFWGKIDRRGPDECWLWTRSTNKLGGGGYGKISIEGRQRLAHRVAYELTHGQIPKGLSVKHSCDEPRCCNPAHLSIGTHADNMRERDERGRRTGGKPRALTPDEVRAIRASIGQRGALEAHARRLGVSSATVSHAAHGRSYRDV